MMMVAACQDRPWTTKALTGSVLLPVPGRLTLLHPNQTHRMVCGPNQVAQLVLLQASSKQMQMRWSSTTRSSTI